MVSMYVDVLKIIWLGRVSERGFTSKQRK